MRSLLQKKKKEYLVCYVVHAGQTGYLKLDGFVAKLHLQKKVNLPPCCNYFAKPPHIQLHALLQLFCQASSPQTVPCSVAIILPSLLTSNNSMAIEALAPSVTGRARSTTYRSTVTPE